MTSQPAITLRLNLVSSVYDRVFDRLTLEVDCPTLDRRYVVEWTEAADTAHVVAWWSSDCRRHVSQVSCTEQSGLRDWCRASDEVGEALERWRRGHAQAV